MAAQVPSVNHIDANQIANMTEIMLAFCTSRKSLISKKIHYDSFNDFSILKWISSNRAESRAKCNLGAHNPKITQKQQKVVVPQSGCLTHSAQKILHQICWSHSGKKAIFCPNRFHGQKVVCFPPCFWCLTAKQKLFFLTVDSHSHTLASPSTSKWQHHQLHHLVPFAACFQESLYTITLLS